MNSDENITKKNNNKKNSKSIFNNINDNSNYCLNLYQLIKKINKTIDVPFQSKDNEYLLNLLLMSPKLNNSNKLICLLLLYYLYRKDKKNPHLLDYLFLKICKYCKKIELSDNNIIQKFLTFPECKNFFYAWEYLSNIKPIFTDEKKIDKNFKNLIDSVEQYSNEKVNLYLEENNYKFNDFKLVPDIHLNKIKTVMEKLLSGNYKINNNNSPIYLIDKQWLYKLKAFIDPYMCSREQDLIKILTESAFNTKKVIEQMKNHVKLDTKKGAYQVYFPGPIYNLDLLQFKNFWYDPVELEENYIINKTMKLNEDYYFLNADDYILLKSIFKDSNELIRKNINDIIYNFKVAIIESRLRKEEYKNLLKIKNMQININEGVKELKKKLIRCINYQINTDNNNINYDELYEKNNVDFFVINKKNKNLLIELFISLVSTNKMYESLYFKKIELKDNENLVKNIFNYFDKDIQILVAEIFPKNDTNYIKQILSVKKNSNIYKCSLCEEELNVMEKYNCNLCNSSLYCSYECAKVSGEHINLHECLDKFYLLNFDVKSFFKENMHLYKENQKDLVTFPKDKINNYSCINSIIHCLSFSTDLTKYILSKKYINDINISDFILNKTTLINYYYELMAKMWKSEGYEKIEFYYQNFIKFLLTKLDYDPNDKSSLNNVREILVAILTTFDKELNRSINLYNNDINKGNNISNKNSIITDLFYGIYQTSFSCSKCGNVSIIYDFFRNLLLPIPKKNSNLTIKYFNEFECKFIHATIDDNSNIKELKDKAIPLLSDKINYIVNMMSITDLIEVTAFDTDDEKILTDIAMYNSIELVQFDKNKIVTKIYLTDKKGEINNNNNDEKKVKNDDNEDEDDIKPENDLNLNLNKIYKESDIELVFYEKSVFEEQCINIYIYPFYYNEKDKLSLNRERLYNVYPIAFPVNISLVLENFEYAVNVRLRNLLIDFYKEEAEKINDNYIELVYPHYFCNFSIYSNINCFLCKEKLKNSLFCPLFASMDKDQTIKDLIQKFEYPKQPIILLAKSKYYDVNKKYYLNMNTFQIKKESKRTVEDKLDLYNCFQLFTNKETLDGIDWFCESCNSIQICEKQLSIYNLPVYLIIQIDRFAIRKTNARNFVDNTLLNFPINNLNLNKYVEGPDKDKINYNYSLYAIIYKDISSRSDFTYCVCKNGKRWVMFKENKISSVTELINKNAHFLFYKREDAQQ